MRGKARNAARRTTDRESEPRAATTNPIRFAGTCTRSHARTHSHHTHIYLTSFISHPIEMIIFCARRARARVCVCASAAVCWCAAGTQAGKVARATESNAEKQTNKNTRTHIRWHGTADRHGTRARERERNREPQPERPNVILFPSFRPLPFCISHLRERAVAGRRLLLCTGFGLDCWCGCQCARWSPLLFIFSI